MNKEIIKPFFKLLIIILFITGLITFFYPFLSNVVNVMYTNKLVSEVTSDNNMQFINEKKRIIEKEKNKKESVTTIGLTADIFEQQSITRLNKQQLKQHFIGTIYIPNINVNIPIFDETNDSLLMEGATLLQGTSYPTGGVSRHTVITGHSGFPEKKLFTDLSELKIGDHFLIDNMEEILKYEIISLKTVLPTETKDLNIKDGEDLTTLLTCTPYMINTHRLLVTGKRVDYNTKMIKQDIDSINKHQLKETIGLLLLLLIILLLFLYSIRMLVLSFKKNKEYE
ncbi:class C sortase [Vagococcus bubulae]|uniref:Class C sortase n=1 Tax=Vagococcus bubulae TaxID=1977868 RepID=A0A429ZBX6_9ENTE|nr:class C sortase [Vagococcus bubulae]RST91207.1 hypothetical protein CBF36_10310 [Vagococcus bubulae]